MGRPKKKQTRKTWTINDLSRMKKLIKSNKPAKTIAVKLGRSEGSIRVKAFLEGISFKSKARKALTARG